MVQKYGILAPYHELAPNCMCEYMAGALELREGLYHGYMFMYNNSLTNAGLLHIALTLRMKGSHVSDDCSRSDLPGSVC